MKKKSNVYLLYIFFSTEHFTTLTLQNVKSCSTFHCTWSINFTTSLKDGDQFLLVKNSNNAISSLYWHLYMHRWLCPIAGTLVNKLLGNGVRDTRILKNCYPKKLWIYVPSLVYVWETISLCPSEVAKAVFTFPAPQIKQVTRSHTNFLQPPQGIIQLTSPQSLTLHNLTHLGRPSLPSLHLHKVHTS